MIYFNKVIAAFLLPPGLLLVLLITINVLLFKHKRHTIAKYLTLVIVLFYMMTVPFISGSLLSCIESQFVPNKNVQGDVIVMLGGGATGDTPDIDGIGNLSGSAANRLLTAARLQKKLNVPLIVSGGKVFEDSGTEAIIAKRMLVGLGVPDVQIYTEDKSLNTTQNALYVKKIIEDNGFKQPILVTSAFHMPRAVINFERAGLMVEPYPSDYKTNRISHIGLFSFLPSAGAFSDTCTVLWEYLGMLALKVQ